MELKRVGVLALGVVSVLGVLPTVTEATLIRPDSATASSTFSGSYDIGNAIDGSGLPVNFTLSDTHATYAVNNHWTTQNGAIAAGTAKAKFFFDDAQTLSQFHLWNHQSNGIASNDYYAVTKFDLILRDAADGVLLSVLDVVAVGGVGQSSAQTFDFAETSGVRSVEFIIDANSAPVGWTGVNYTGVAEVAFGLETAIPEPSSLGLLALGGAALLSARRRVAGR